MTDFERFSVGEIRPSQIIHTFGVGSIVDLPRVSAVVLGLDAWEPPDGRRVISEDRLLAVVRNHLGGQVQRLVAPPVPESAERPDPFDPDALKGVPVAAFPSWVKCPMCDLIAPLDQGVFELKRNRFRPDRSGFVHANCAKARKPHVIPVRFVRSCENGHLDDFPWHRFVHQGDSDCRSTLRLYEFGVSAQADDITVKCETCSKSLPMTAAFTDQGKDLIRVCRGQHPHTGVEEKCDAEAKSMLLGASNAWFAVTVSALSIPSDAGQLEQAVRENWVMLDLAKSVEIVEAFRRAGNLDALAAWSDEEVWAAVQAKRAEDEGGDTDEDARVDTIQLKEAEWDVFSQPDPALASRDFQLTEEPPPPGYEAVVEKVVRLDRLRAVQAQIGFTRILSPGDYADVSEIPDIRRVPLARAQPSWVPASETRGEGIFLQLEEGEVARWEQNAQVAAAERQLMGAHRSFRQVRKIEPPEGNFPGMRFVLLHTLSHALIRQLAIECGYTAASIRERIYSRSPDLGSPMAGILLYTAASDSEGTLGGLVSQGEPAALARHLYQALEAIRLCASDPLCAEHVPGADGAPTLHGAACHACGFASETSCESGNKYLDRSTLIEKVSGTSFGFFDHVLQADR